MYRSRDYKGRRFVTVPFQRNCWFVVIWLLVSGRLRALRWKKPFHLFGVTRSGNLVHFKSTGINDRFRPWWFEGRVEVIRRKQVSVVLAPAVGMASIAEGFQSQSVLDGFEDSSYKRTN
jgi:hypothetical protein